MLDLRGHPPPQEHYPSLYRPSQDQAPARGLDEEGIGRGLLGQQRHPDDPGLDSRRAQGAGDHPRPQVGHPRAQGRLRGQGLLRLVRRADRLYLHDRLRRRRAGLRLEVLVAEPRRSRALPVHRQGQHPLPYRHLPLEPPRLGQALDHAPPHVEHRVPQLRGRQILQVEGRRRVRHRRGRVGYPRRRVALLHLLQPARAR